MNDSIESAIPENPLLGAKICGLSGIQAILCKFLGSKFWALGGLNDISKNKVCRVLHGEVKARKWLDSIEKQKSRIDLKFVRDRQTDGQKHRQSQRQKNNNRLLAYARRSISSNL